MHVSKCSNAINGHEFTTSVVNRPQQIGSQRGKNDN